MAVSFKCTGCGNAWPAEPVARGGGIFSIVGGVMYPITCPGCGATYDQPSGQVVRSNMKATVAPTVPGYQKRYREKKKMRHPHLTEEEARARLFVPDNPRNYGRGKR